MRLPFADYRISLAVAPTAPHAENGGVKRIFQRDDSPVSLRTLRTEKIVFKFIITITNLQYSSPSIVIPTIILHIFLLSLKKALGNYKDEQENIAYFSEDTNIMSFLPFQDVVHFKWGF